MNDIKKADFKNAPDILKKACSQLFDELEFIKPDDPYWTPGNVEYGYSDCWIAGGAIRSRIAFDGLTDIDCYFSTNSLYLESKSKILKNYIYNPQIIYTDSTVTTIKTEHINISDWIRPSGVFLPAFSRERVQNYDLITRAIGKAPMQGIADFDFTCCALAIDKEHRIYWHKDALDHIEQKKLVILNPYNILGTLMRIQKYALKGYKLDIDNAKKFLESVPNGLKSSEYEFQRLSFKAAITKY